MAYIGRSMGSNEDFGEPNPIPLLSHADFYRAEKTPWELHLMRQASEVGARGHQAAEGAFLQRGTEFDIHMAYLMASAQTEAQLPYANIIALNEHAATLHYTLHDKQHSSPPRSLLIDAGGNASGYASDITRTHATPGRDHQVFADLIAAMQLHQDKLLSSIEPGLRFADLHVQMHEQLTDLLIASDIAQCSVDQARQLRLSDAFCPHGLGHLLGIQVHDVGGHQADPSGTPAPPPPEYPTLRFTREVRQDYVFTVEPGLYFIESLLEPLRAAGAPLNWRLIDSLWGYGGIRIEDNVRVLERGIENLTRDAWLRAAND